jgi:tRNA-specific 2-thiouridylase
VKKTKQSFELLRGVDAGKDQSYFLHRLNQEQLSRVVFPVGELKKPEVRRLALEAGLPNHAKKDSTGICFIGERPFREFLNRYLPKAPGPIKTPEGRVVGEHIGLAFYTIGQRKGIGIGGMANMKGEAWYVADKRRESNELIVVQGHDHPSLMKRELKATDPAWIGGNAPEEERALSAKTRYRQADAVCTLEGVLESEIRVGFEAPQWAVTPGQSVVLYEGEVCLGGGIIT